MPDTSAYKTVWAAVLGQAIHDAKIRRRSKANGSAVDRDTAREWLASDDIRAGGFVWV